MPISGLTALLAVRDHGRVVGGETDGRLLGGAGRQIRAMLLSPFVSQMLGTFAGSENAEDLDALPGPIEAEELAPVIDRAFPLGEVPAAIRYLLDRSARGKIVMTLGA